MLSASDRPFIFIIMVIDTLYKVEDKLKECRNILDDKMYRQRDCTEEEYKHLRDIYDSICRVMDKL